MIRASFRFTALLLMMSVATAVSCQAQDYRSTLYDFTVVTVTGGLEHPWSMAFLPDGDILVTERPGRLRIIRDGVLMENPVAGVPEVHAQGQGGLLDVVLHPNFSSNRLLYLSYSKPLEDEDGATTVVARAHFENDRLTDVEELFEADSRGGGHYGSRLAFDSEGFLFITVGDRQAPPRGDLEAHPAQDLSNHHGTTNRIHDDGRIPDDNPFVNESGARPEIWSYGHRNQQGLAIHPESGDIWATEHGPQGGDELNLIRPGLNYGWPVIGYGVNYRSGTAIHEGTHRDGMEQPANFWVPSIATSGLMIYTGDIFPEWKGNIFVGGMAGTQIARLTLDGQRVVSEETLVKGLGRIRDIRQGPDGYIYLAIDSDAGPQSIVRLEPTE
ncbi:MAG: PQQ-dependent sugar dehydrogenase [Bacteroidetes bacterium]|nr:PQQ-dependent sugar dehydrogenase [Bacteroidota bacterium]